MTEWQTNKKDTKWDQNKQRDKKTFNRQIKLQSFKETKSDRQTGKLKAEILGKAWITYRANYRAGSFLHDIFSQHQYCSYNTSHNPSRTLASLGTWTIK